MRSLPLMNMMSPFIQIMLLAIVLIILTRMLYASLR